LGGSKGIWPVKKLEWWGTGMVICLKRDADLNMAQLMPLPLTVSCFSKIQIGFTFLVPAHQGNPGKRAIKQACVRVCVRTPVYSGMTKYRKGPQRTTKDPQKTHKGPQRALRAKLQEIGTN